MGQFQLSCLVVCEPLTPVVLWTHTSRQALMSEGFFLKHNPLSMTVYFTWFHQTLSARTILQRRKKTVFSRSQHFSCRFLLGGNHWKSCPTQFTEALGPAYRNRRTGLLVSANKMLGFIGVSDSWSWGLSCCDIGDRLELVRGTNLYLRSCVLEDG